LYESRQRLDQIKQAIFVRWLAQLTVHQYGANMLAIVVQGLLICITGRFFSS